MLKAQQGYYGEKGLLIVLLLTLWESFKFRNFLNLGLKNVVPIPPPCSLTPLLSALRPSRYVVDARWYETWKKCVGYLEESSSTSDISGVAKSPETQDDMDHQNGEMENEVPPNMTASDPGIIASAANWTCNNMQPPRKRHSGRIPDPIDNSALMSGTGTNVDMKRDLIEYEDYVLLPEGVYSLLESWYDGGPRLPRSVIERGSGSNANFSVELWPLRVHIHLCKPSGAPQQCSIAEILVSRMITLGQLRSNVLAMVNPSHGSESRVSFRVRPVDNSTAATTEARPGTKNVKRRFSRARENLESNAVTKIMPEEAEWIEVEHGSNSGYCSSSYSSGESVGSAEEWHIVEPRMMQRKLDAVLADDGLLDLAALVEMRSSPNEEFPRDHVVNKWREELKVGDVIDAMDMDGKWYESVVKEIYTKDNTVCVHYKGWQPKWDISLARSSPNIQRLHTHTEDWWKDIVVGSKVEVVKRESDGKTKWYRGTVIAFSKDDNNVVNVNWEGQANSGWYDKMSEEICCIGTHTKTPAVVPDGEIQRHGPVVSKGGSGGGGEPWGKRYNTKGIPPEPGAVGLCNLGNTCFMNSMIQCLSHTMIWTKYFRCGEWRHDLNEGNPLGMQGLIAKEYAELIKQLWCGDYSCVSPSDLKHTIGQFAPAFAGYCQQDSQELMILLLDGLHEGLNRVHQKPYVENFRSDRLDDSTIAEECWRRYLMRNDSVFVDTHHGLLRSHVTCPNCKYESITFDPYIQLQLAIPVKSSVMVNLIYIPIPKHYWDRSKDIVGVKERQEIQGGSSMDEGMRMIIHLEESATMLDMKKAVGMKVGIPFECLYAVDMWKLKIWSVFDDSKSISSMVTSDSIWVFELEHPVSTGSAIRTMPLPISSSSPNTANRAHVVNAHFIIPPATTQEESGAAISCTDAETIPPLVLSLTNTTTNAQVHKRLVSHLLVFLQCVEPMPILADTKMESPTADVVTMSMDEDTEVVGVVPSEKSPSQRTSMRVEDLICVSFVAAQVGSRSSLRKNIGRDVPPDNTIVLIDLGAKKSEELRVELKLEASKFWRPKNVYSDKFGVSEDAEEASVSLDMCIDKFVEMEELGPTEQWYCINCKGSYQAFKKMDVWSTPDILIIHLKRFLQHMSGSYSVRREKIEAFVDFPVNGLDLSPYLKVGGHECTVTAGNQLCTYN